MRMALRNSHVRIIPSPELDTRSEGARPEPGTILLQRLNDLAEENCALRNAVAVQMKTIIMLRQALGRDE